MLATIARLPKTTAHRAFLGLTTLTCLGGFLLGAIGTSPVLPALLTLGLFLVTSWGVWRLEDDDVLLPVDEHYHALFYLNRAFGLALVSATSWLIIGWLLIGDLAPPSQLLGVNLLAAASLALVPLAYIGAQFKLCLMYRDYVDPDV